MIFFYKEISYLSICQATRLIKQIRLLSKASARQKIAIIITFYINNIIIFFRIAKKHFQHLKSIFALFARFKIILKAKKSYLNYILITSFKQRVNNFKFITIEK